ncbi:hypothetical protein [Micromonospora sp. WMMD736]
MTHPYQMPQPRTSATVSMALTLDSGFTDRHLFTLVKEDDAWKVCGQPY